MADESLMCNDIAEALEKPENQPVRSSALSTDGLATLDYCIPYFSMRTLKHALRHCWHGGHGGQTSFASPDGGRGPAQSLFDRPPRAVQKYATSRLLL